MPKINKFNRFFYVVTTASICTDFRKSHPFLNSLLRLGLVKAVTETAQLINKIYRTLFRSPGASAIRDIAYFLSTPVPPLGNWLSDIHQEGAMPLVRADDNLSVVDLKKQ